MNNCAKITVMKGNAKDSNTMKKHQYVYVITVITEEKENTMKNVNMAKLNCISNCPKDGCSFEPCYFLTCPVSFYDDAMKLHLRCCRS